MGRCSTCGKWGLFLAARDGLCTGCLEKDRVRAMGGKFVVKACVDPLGSRYSLSDEMEAKIRGLIGVDACAKQIEEAEATIALSGTFHTEGFYSDGSVGSRLDLTLTITDKKERVLFSRMFLGGSPAQKIYRFADQRSGSVTGLVPKEEVLNYIKDLLAKYRIAQNDDTSTHLLRIMVLAALADGEVNEAENAAIRTKYLEISGRPLTAEALGKEVSLARAANATLSGYADRLAREPAKVRIEAVRVAFHAMSANPTLLPGHDEQLAKLGPALRIADAQYRALLVDLRSGSVHEG